MNSSLADDDLRRLLRRAWPTPSFPPDPTFRAAVWARIDALNQQPETWVFWLRGHMRGVAFSAAASIVFAVAGGGFAAAAGFEREREQLVDKYLASIDPHARTVTSPITATQP